MVTMQENRVNHTDRIYTLNEMGYIFFVGLTLYKALGGCRIPWELLHCTVKPALFSPGLTHLASSLASPSALCSVTLLTLGSNLQHGFSAPLFHFGISCYLDENLLLQPVIPNQLNQTPPRGPPYSCCSLPPKSERCGFRCTL